MRFFGMLSGLIFGLLLIGSLGIQESMASEWKIGGELSYKDYFKYVMCHVDHNNCEPFEMYLWISPPFDNNQDIMNFETMVIDGDKKIRGTMYVDSNNGIPKEATDDIFSYSKIFAQLLTDISFYLNQAPEDVPTGDFEVDTKYNATGILRIRIETNSTQGMVLLAENIPFPIKGNQTKKSDVLLNRPETHEKIFDFELLEFKKDAKSPDFLTYDPDIDQFRILNTGTIILKLQNNSTSLKLPEPSKHVVRGIWIFVSSGVINPTLHFDGNYPTGGGGWNTNLEPGKPTLLDFQNPLTVSNVNMQYENTCCDEYVRIGYYFPNDEIKYNEIPFADAGNDFDIRPGILGTLNGSKSFDPNNNPIFFEWKQIGGSKVELEFFNSTIPIFDTNHLVLPESLQFQLTVKNSKNNISYDYVHVDIVPSPQKMIQLGIKPIEITCMKHLDLIFKFTNNSPACVKSSTAEKLVERGWQTLSDLENKLHIIHECENNGGIWYDERDRCRILDFGD